MSGSLSHSPADIIWHLLIAEGQATLPSADGDWPAFVGNLPDAPDNCMAVIDTAGVMDGSAQVSGEQYEHFGFTVQLRHAGFAAGYAKAREVAVALDEDVLLDGVTVGSNTYVVYAVTRRSGPIAIRESPTSKRHLFTINAVVALRQTT